MKIFKKFFTVSLLIVYPFLVNNAFANVSNVSTLHKHVSRKILPSIPPVTSESPTIDSSLVPLVALISKNISNSKVYQILNDQLNNDWFFSSFADYIKSKKIFSLSTMIVDNYNVKAKVSSQIVGNTYKASENYELNPLTMLAVIEVESKFNPDAKNKNAVGLTQTISTLHKEKFRHKSVYDIEANIDVGAKILSDCFKKYDGVEIKALKCYHGDKVANNVPNIYVNKVLAKKKSFYFALNR